MRLITSVATFLLTTSISPAAAVTLPNPKPACFTEAPATIACNQTKAGELEYLDCSFSSGYQRFNYDAWSLAAAAGSYVRFRLSTTEFFFDPQLAAYAPNGQLAGVGEDESIGQQTDVIEGFLPAGGVWTLMVTSEEALIGDKAYTLQVDCLTPPQPPAIATPTALTATATSPTTIALTWQDWANNESEYRVEVREGDGSYVDLGGLPANTSAIEVIGRSAGTEYTFRVRAVAGTLSSAYSNEATATTPAEPDACVPDADTACLLGGRFQVRVHFANPNANGAATIMSFSGETAANDQSAFFYFTNPANFEMGVKMVAGCGLNGNYWFYVSGLTNQEWLVQVIDTDTGTERYYYNPLNRLSETTADTAAFPCP
jgi:YD repeat-containing protein